MKRLFRPLVYLLILISANLFVSGMHASASSVQPANQMPGMKHATTLPNCTLSCNIASANKTEENEISDKDDDKKANDLFPSYSQLALTSLNNQHTAEAMSATKAEPPPGVPYYIQFSVFRS